MTPTPITPLQIFPIPHLKEGGGERKESDNLVVFFAAVRELRGEKLPQNRFGLLISIKISKHEPAE